MSGSAAQRTGRRNQRVLGAKTGLFIPVVTPHSGCCWCPGELLGGSGLWQRWVGSSPCPCPARTLASRGPAVSDLLVLQLRVLLLSQRPLRFGARFNITYVSASRERAHWPHWSGCLTSNCSHSVCVWRKDDFEMYSESK